VERCKPRLRADEPNPVEHARIGGVSQDDLVTRIREAEERVEHCVAFAARDHDLAGTVVAWAAAPLDVRGHRVLQVVAAGEREPAVRIVFADRGPGRLDRFLRRPNVGVEVLQPKDVGVVTCRCRDAVDVEPGYALEAPDAHRGPSVARLAYAVRGRSYSHP
jgi:hypothetical protein